ncbi:hypothetical protein, partial [Moorena producens]|uniref:hypothetical protein n=1 Tax=Moorena producens TaxID=1155739 RepID=UPI001A96ED57
MGRWGDGEIGTVTRIVLVVFGAIAYRFSAMCRRHRYAIAYRFSAMCRRHRYAIAYWFCKRD